MQLGKGIICLSVFDGISCGRIALERARIKVDKYYASEIDENAISITQKNFPNTIQLKDVRNWKNWNINFSEIDLLLAGFPCQSWSVAGLQKGILDERGQLLFDLIDIWKHIDNEKEKCNKEPVKFLFENVRMKSEFILYISKLFQVDPIEINSSLVSAQNRERLYWTNIHNIQQPIDKQIMLKDILLENTNPEIDISSFKVPFDKSLKILEKEIERRKIGYFNTDSQANRVYSIHGKSVTLCGDAGGGSAKMGQYLFGCITPDRINKHQNGQRLSKGDKFYTLTAQDSHGVLLDGYIRKLTPLECERLQTLPDKVFYGIIQLKDLLCLDQAKSYVSAVEKNHRLLRLVLSAEKYELREYVNYVIENMNANHQSIKHTAQKNVDMQTLNQIEKCTNIKKEELNTTAKIVEENTKPKSQEKEGVFAVANVLMNLAEGRIAHNGKVESLLKDNSTISQESGKSVLNLSFREMMELVKDVELGTQKIKDMNTTFITSYPLSIENIETMLIISYYFAKDVIDGCIPIKTQINNLYLSLTNGYTFGVSNNQRYKVIGNGWTVDVIAHILKNLYVTKEESSSLLDVFSN